MRRVLDVPLQVRIGASIAIGLLVIFALFGVLGWSLLRQSVERVAGERLMIAQLATSLMDTELKEQFEMLERAAPTAALALAGGSPQEIMPAALPHAEPFVTSVFLVDRSGRLQWSDSLGSTQPDADIAAALGVGQVFDGAGRFVSGVRLMGSAPRPFAVLAVPCFDPKGVYSGALGAMVDVNHSAFRDLIATARQLGKTGHAEIVDQHGLVVASSEVNRALGPGEHPSFYRPLLASRTPGGAITEPIGDEDPAERGQRHAMVFSPFRTVPWGLSLGGSESELFREAEQWRSQMAIFGALGLLAALCLIWFTMRSIARSVRQLTQASRRIGAGDLNTPVPDLGEGEVHTLAAALDDMRRHLHEALDALAVEKSRYQGIVGSMADAVFTTDARLQITTFNPAAEVLTGWQRDDALGLPCGEVFRSLGACSREGCSTRCLFAPGTALAKAGNATKETIQRRDGRPTPVVHALSAVRDSDEALVGMVHILRDISSEEELERLKDQFLSMITHELRTPLGYIKGYATTLLLPDRPTDDETVQRCLRIIVEASDELEGLIDNLLDMSKIGAGAFGIAPEPTRLSPLIHAAVERARLGSKGHRLSVKVPASLAPVSADVHRIEQVLYNLLDNALKFSPNGGRIVVTAETAAQEAIVSLSDEGMGIPPAEIDDLFRAFHRGQSARAQGIGGSGLGLAICRGIVEAHGGRIWAESPAPGRTQGASPGTVIRFTMPLARKTSRAKRNGSTDVAEPALRASAKVDSE